MARLPLDAPIRPSVREGLPVREEHPLGERRVPRRQGAFGLVETFLRGGCPSRVVPEEFWAQDVNDEGHPIAVVACPCGQEPRPELGAYPTECQCQRWFFYTGTSVFALNGPASA